MSTTQRVVDCDVHNSMASFTELTKWLPSEWRQFHETYGRGGFPGGRYPTRTREGARVEAWPPNGRTPGSDAQFMVTQHLDPFGIDYAILGPLAQTEQRNPEYAAAVATAVNNWTREEWLDVDSRLRGSIVVPYEYPDLAAAEVRRIASDRRFVQVYLFAMTSRPLGHRQYWPIYAAAVDNDLPVAIHFGSPGGKGAGNAFSGVGWPTYYLEHHAGGAQAFQAQATSLIFEGVFEAFPTLKLVLIEGGVAWLPSLAWRMDRAHERFAGEVPNLKRRPSEYIAEHVWLTTQPIEEPDNPKHLREVFESFPSLAQRLMFSSDYPHWDYDEPNLALRKSRLPRDMQLQIMFDNAAALYGLS